jgi:hypothetical protein
MTSKPSPASMKIANQLINLANDLLGQGHTSKDIAAGLRHAAANFTAFDLFQSDAKVKDPNIPVEEFLSQFEYYLDRHEPKDTPRQPTPSSQGLLHLVEQAKNEVKN